MHEKVPVDEASLPFLSSGYIPLSGSSKKVSLVSVLFFSEETDTGDSVLVLGIGLVVEPLLATGSKINGYFFKMKEC